MPQAPNLSVVFYFRLLLESIKELGSASKCLDVVKAFVGRTKIMQKVAKYDTKFLMLLLVVAFHLQNPGFIDLIDALMVVDEDSIFGVVTLNKGIM